MTAWLLSSEAVKESRGLELGEGDEFRIIQVEFEKCVGYTNEDVQDKVDNEV